MAGGPDIQMLIQQAVQQAMASQGGGAAEGGGAEPIKPKIDVNIEIMQMKKMMARIADHMGIHIPAQEMTATSQDLTQMGMEDQGAAAGGAPPPSAIAPPDPIQAAMPAMPAPGGEKTSALRGRAVPQINSMRDLGDRASAMSTILRQQLAGR